MDCNNLCKEEINKILQNNEKMEEIVNKGKNRRYTEKERNEYNELFDHGEKLELDRQMCMNGCEERKRHYGDATGMTRGGCRSLSRKVRSKKTRKLRQRQRQRRRIGIMINHQTRHYRN